MTYSPDEFLKYDLTEAVGSDDTLLNNLNNMEKKGKFDFLFSPRFWQLFLAGVSAGLATYSQSKDILLSISVAISGWLTGSVVVGTFDRNADKKLEAANASGAVTTVTMPVNSSVTASTEK